MGLSFVCDHLTEAFISRLSRYTGETLYECNRIDYFSKEEYSPDPNDSTLAIPYAVTRSVIFFATATFLLCGGYCCCILGHCVKHRGLYTFISGVVFIVTGLVMLFGLVMYISIFKAEIGGKLRPKSQLQPPAFTYKYGYSFLLYVCGFVSTQLAGISAIFLFIYKMQYDFRKKQLEDYRRGKIPRSQPSSVNYVHVDYVFHSCRRHPDAYNRRHPDAYINSNSIHIQNIPTNYPPPAEKRYFFSKEPRQESPCSLHRNHSTSNSLKDLSNFYDLPPPPTISYQFEEHAQYNMDTLRHFPRDVTTNTVSTTADVTCDDFLTDRFDDYSPSIQHEHEFVTFDLDQALPLRAQSSASINSRNGNGNKKDNDPMRRTTPV
ncbi:PMP-22/EMP/MP20/Claudin tight junction [Popillia japonica]|uniref:PMP-22/EMP/MP20/Claudin tight junction n=1 Tax=Popillia japonica TaxID=7064 RepID=A0AAW1LWI8_POPJA